MKKLVLLALGTLAAALSTGTRALPGTFVIDQLYSNASGTVQFIVVRDLGANDCDAGEANWHGQRLAASGAAPLNVYFFPSDLPTCHTSGKRILIATQSFAALGLVTPDFVIPDHFVQTPSGKVTLDDAGGLTYSGLPADGVTALNGNGAPVPNLATNLAGVSASITSLPPAAVDLTQHGLTGSWYEPATAGQGVEVEVYPGVGGAGSAFYQVSWFTYDAVAGGAEHQRWYTLSGGVQSVASSIALTIYRNVGGNFDAGPVTAGQSVGTATLAFDGCTSGRLDYSFTDGSNLSGSIPLTRLTQNVTCATGAAPSASTDFALSGNWFDPATSGQGITVEVNPVSTTLFLAWYTYAPGGANAGVAGQRWYTAAGSYSPGARSVALQIYETTGGVFDMPVTSAQTSTAVGSATLVFASCTSATLTFSFTGGTNGTRSGTIDLARVGPVPPGCA